MGKFLTNLDVNTAWVYFNNDYGGAGPQNA